MQTHMSLNSFCFISKRLVPPYNVIKDELNADDHHTYYCGQDSLRRNGIALTLIESKMQYLCAISKTTE